MCIGGPFAVPRSVAMQRWCPHFASARRLWLDSLRRERNAPNSLLRFGPALIRSSASDVCARSTNPRVVRATVRGRGDLDAGSCLLLAGVPELGATHAGGCSPGAVFPLEHCLALRRDQHPPCARQRAIYRISPSPNLNGIGADFESRLVSKMPRSGPSRAGFYMDREGCSRYNALS